MMRTFLVRAVALFQRRRRDSGLDDEVRTHLELLEAEYLRRGMAAEEARFAARRAFGGVEQMKERYRDGQGRWVEHARRDVRYAWRTMVRNPGYAATAIVTLALGIGANTAVFSVVDAAMFRALPVSEPERLVAIDSDRLISYPAFQRFRNEPGALSGVAATTGPQRFVVRWPGAAPEVAVGTEVSSEYFPVLGAGIAVGRPFRASDERPGAPGVGVISHDVWQRRFAARPDVLGQSVLVNALPVTIIGVAAAGFRGEVTGATSEFWVLIPQIRPAPDLANRAGSFFQIVGRLRPDVTLADAQASLASIVQQVLATEPEPMDRTGTSPSDRPSIYLQPGGGGLSVLLQRFELPLWLGLAFVGVVLGVACANLAGLSLARAVGRQQEMSIRGALGASRARLIAQLLTESVCLASAGGVVGMLIAYIVARPLTSLLAGGLVPLSLDVSPNLRVMAFAAAVSMGTGVLVGLAPARRAALSRPVRAGVGSIHLAPQLNRLAAALVTGQVAVSVLLLITAGLLVGSLRHLGDVDPGFDRDQVLLVDVASTAAQDGALLTARLAQLRDRVLGLPGVSAVSASWLPIFEPFADLSADLSVEGYTPRAGEFVFARYNVVSAGYFRTVGMRIVAGREFTAADTDRTASVVVVNESFARKYFGNRNPVGRVVAIANGPREVLQPRVIVGVIGDARYNDVRREILPMFYAPLPQLPRRVQSIEVRTTGPANPLALGPSLRTAIAAVAPEWVVEGVRPIAQQIDRPIAAERFVARVGAAGGVLALVLAVVGLYGLLSYLVARSAPEIGIRVALGATVVDVIQPVLHKTARIVTGGVVLGVSVALLTTRAVSRFLYGLSATDPLVVASVASLVVGIALAAAFVPARRAANVDPVVALRSE